MQMWKSISMLFVLLTLLHDAKATSCRIGRAACMASCVAQNCATGYCPNGEQGVCVCSRCGTGPWNPPRF